MHHVAIMKKDWGLIEKILEGTKTVESRWYKTKRSPWDKIKPGDTVYFKDSGSPVTVKAVASRVKQYTVGGNKHALEIMKTHALEDLGTLEISTPLMEYITNKKYAVFVWFDNVEEVEPFDIDKTDFGMQSAWLSVEDVSQVRVGKV